MKKKIQKKAVLIIFLIMFVWGFVATFSYGKYWDENTEMRILYSHCKEYVMTFMPKDSQVYQEYETNMTPRISEYYEKDHGNSAYYLIQPLMRANISASGKMYIWHIYTYLIFFLGTICLYYIMKQMTERKDISLLTALMYFTTPRIFANGHYNNKDMALLSFSFFLIAIFLSLLNRVTFLKIVGAAFVAGVLASSKLIGVAIVGGITAMYFCSAIAKKEKAKNILFVCGGGLIFTTLFYIVLTPAMWSNPREYFEYVLMNAMEFQRWGGYVRFLGTDYCHKGGCPLPEWYLIAMILITTPIYILIFSFVGHVSLLIHLIKEKLAFFKNWRYIALVLLMALWMLPLGYAVLTNMMVYNDWRHFYFTYSSLIIFAGYGIYSVLEHVRNAWSKRRLYVGYTLLGVCILTIIIELIIYHPYQYCYYNVLARKNADTVFEMDYWNISMKDALERVLQDEGERISLCGLDKNSQEGIEDAIDIVENGERIDLYDISEWRKADYLVINKTYGLIYEEEMYQYVRDNYQLMDSITAYGNTLIEIYKNKE